MLIFLVCLDLNHFAGEDEAVPSGLGGFRYFAPHLRYFAPPLSSCRLQRPLSLSSFGDAELVAMATAMIIGAANRRMLNRRREDGASGDRNGAAEEADGDNREGSISSYLALTLLTPALLEPDADFRVPF